MSVKPAITIAAPSFGPALVTLFGVDVPVAATSLAIAGLVLARYIAPPPKRALTRQQTWALTALLTVILVAAVVTMQPGPGMAVAWGVGLGFSGLLAVEFFGRRILTTLKAISEPLPKGTDE